MLMPSIFGESLFDDFDNLMNFSFPDVDKHCMANMQRI